MSNVKLVSLSFYHVYYSAHECYIISSSHMDLYSLLFTDSDWHTCCV